MIKPMKLEEIQEHWTDWADSYGQELRATTKTWTIKMLEVDALNRAIERAVKEQGLTGTVRVLEVGCGNGINCIDLAKLNSNLEIDGFDYIAEMVEAANKNMQASPYKDRLRFFQADLMNMDASKEIDGQYDIIFTNRVIINLNTLELQKQAIKDIQAKLKPGGHLLMIENSLQTYTRQNEFRTMLGIQPRTPDKFNLFLDDDVLLPFLKEINLEASEVEDFGTLHDLILYVLLPALNNGETDYDHPLVEVATKLSREISAKERSKFGVGGQNRLYFCRKST